MFIWVNDFGYLKYFDEILEIWQWEEVLGDVVWVIWKWQLDVIINCFDYELVGCIYGYYIFLVILFYEVFDLVGDFEVYLE